MDDETRKYLEGMEERISAILDGLRKEMKSDISNVQSDASKVQSDFTKIQSEINCRLQVMSGAIAEFRLELLGLIREERKEGWESS